MILLSTIGALAACSSGDEASGGYPSLRSVPDAARASTSVDARRNIVRGLIDERDRSRRQTAAVRARSGLGVEGFPSLPGDDLEAEDVIPEGSSDDGQGFRLTPGQGDGADSVYRGEPQFEDGSLDDFIRKLRRETRPDVPAAEPAPDETGPKDVDARRLDPATAPLLRAAFAPAIGQSLTGARDVMIRLAAAEGEPGFFCSYFGWTVAWSSMCVDDAGTEALPESDEDVGADLEQETERADQDTASDSDRSARSESSTPNETSQERAERRLSEEDAAEAIENAGRSALAPVTGSLEKLRNFIEARRARGAALSREEQAPSLQRIEPAAPAAAIDRPPLPRLRPERRENVSIVDRGERFDFFRTPRPHLRPARDEPVILQPLRESARVNGGRARSGSDRPPRPRFKPTFDEPPIGALPSAHTQTSEPAAPQPRPLTEPESAPGDSAAEPDATTPEEVRAAQEKLAASVAALAERVSDVEAADKAAEMPEATAKASEPASEAPATLAPPEAEPAELPSTELEPVIIRFQPGTPRLPEGTGSRLAALLTHAKATDQTIHVIGEASTHHLARRRATDVGAALVQLGATVEILEYDHQARTGVDQVRLVLRPETEDPLFSTTAPTTIEQ